MPTMQITIDLPVNENGEVVIPIRKIGGEQLLRPNDISPENKTRVWLYGATQVTNDSHASVKVDPEKMTDEELLTAYSHVQAAIDKRWDAIYSGEWRVRAANGESANPIENLAMTLARDAIRVAYNAARKVNKSLVKWGDIDEDKRDAAAKAELAKRRDSYMAQARERLDARNAAGDAVNLADLGL